MRCPATRVFVYGTLMQGEANHRLLADAQFLGEARTAPGFTLHDLGAFPAMVPGSGQAVEGEVYAVSAETLARLDRLEGHPRFYCRALITLDDGSVAQAYLLPRERVARHAVIPSGSWRVRPGAADRKA